MASYRMASLGVYFVLLILAFLAAPHVIFGQDRTREERESRISGQYIVVFKDSVANVETAENELLVKAKGEHLDSYRNALRGFAARFSENELAKVTSDPRVEFVSEDHAVSIADSASGLREEVQSFSSWRSRDKQPAPSPDPSPPPPSPSPSPSPDPSASAPSQQAVSPQSLQPLPTGVKRIKAGGLANTGEGVDVAIIDTGISAQHPDLAGKVVGGKNCSTGSGSYIDQNGHGTHVAGTIAALNNTFGVVGVAPGARLWAVRVLDKNGGGSWSTVICGLDFVTSQAPKNGGKIRVANLSLGGGGFSDNNCGNSNNDALHKAICRARDAGVTIVVAAGNSGANAANFVPAAYDDAVITVSALADTDGAPGGLGAGTSYGSDDTFASFSNWGSAVDIGAPGVLIKSTWLGNGYNTISGTSMASPHVAGVVALYLATHLGVPWTDVRDALVAAGEPSGAGHTDPSGKHPERVLQVGSL